MPRPPLLPTLDWKSIFDSGLSYSDWLQNAEMEDHQNQMIQNFKTTAVYDHERAGLCALSRAVNVVVIAEDWCGDVVKHVPSLEKLVYDCDRVSTSYITREQHTDVFVRFLTNGGEAIPKIIFLSEKFVETGNWGPMPTRHRRLISQGKGAGDVGAARKIISALYKSDAGNREAVAEFIDLIGVAATPEIIAPVS